MNCESAIKNFSMFLYGELSLEDEQAFQDHLDLCGSCRQAFAAEKAIHEALDRSEMLPPEALLNRCRRDLRHRLEGAANRRMRWRAWLAGFHLQPLLRPAGALALVAVGFVAARWTAPRESVSPEATVRPAVATGEPMVSRVRYVQPDSSGRVQVVVEETRERVLTGDPQADPIRNLLLAAARESSDPGLRLECMDIFRRKPDAGGQRAVLLYALEHDPNPGVRLKALDALKPYAAEGDVRKALTSALLGDSNPGVRTQAIDLLMQHKPEDDVIGVFQQLVQNDDNNYVRQRCRRALQEMNASLGTF